GGVMRWLSVIPVLVAVLITVDARAGMIVESIEPNRGLQGSVVRLTITGDNFYPGLTVTATDGVIVASDEFVYWTVMRAMPVLSAKPGVASVMILTVDGQSESTPLIVDPNTLRSDYLMISSSLLSTPREPRLIDGAGAHARFSNPRSVW